MKNRTLNFSKFNKIKFDGIYAASNLKNVLQVIYEYLSAAIRSLRFLHTFWHAYRMNIKFQRNAQKESEMIHEQLY